MISSLHIEQKSSEQEEVIHMKRVYATHTEEEKEQLTRIAADRDAAPSELLAAFAADITGSVRSGGSDERMFAVQWLERQVCRWSGGKMIT